MSVGNFAGPSIRAVRVSAWVVRGVLEALVIQAVMHVTLLAILADDVNCICMKLLYMERQFCRITNITCCIYILAKHRNNTECYNDANSINNLVLRVDDLENRLRRNNMIVQGLSEIQDESSDALLSKVSLWFSGTLKMQCPRIERLHRIDATQGNS